MWKIVVKGIWKQLIKKVIFQECIRKYYGGFIEWYNPDFYKRIEMVKNSRNEQIDERNKITFNNVSAYMNASLSEK